ncbi:MAG TPA: ABC transporter ATP-binding protein [Bryobacteraceae bacterium]|nr:ABC transporter ATP-binding protein [Bryobacteraceae bacterium]
MSSDIAIRTRGLTKVFRSRFGRREVRAVDGISLDVPRGTTFGLLGPNGAGKTTFVKLLLSAVHPSSGSAAIFGRDSRNRNARRPVGYLPENHRFPTYLNGAGMLDFYAALSGMPARDRAGRVAELLDLVDLGRWAGVRLRKYSKGMLQRLGLAQALMHRPALLILDEPTDGVDPVGRALIREILADLERRGVTIFLNSHLLGEVELFCRQVAIIHHGRLALTGSVKDLTTGKGYCVTAMKVPPAIHDRLRGESTHDTVSSFRFNTREEVNQAIDALRSAGAEIESVAPSTSTLEEVFLRTVQAGSRE